MGKLLLISAVLCAVVLATGMCAATGAERQGMVAKRDHHSRLESWLDEDAGQMMDWESEAEDEEEEDEEEEDYLEIQSSKSGVTYVRWGRTKCPKGAELVYAGRAAGSYYKHSGGGANYLCAVTKPKNFDSELGKKYSSYMYGAEYKSVGSVPSIGPNLDDHDVPCAVCYVKSRGAKLMIPGTYECPDKKWTREYYGYLMAEHYKHRRSTFECMDKDAETAIGGGKDKDGALFYFVGPRCGSLPCPFYDKKKVVTCAVCTR